MKHSFDNLTLIILIIIHVLINISMAQNAGFEPLMVDVLGSPSEENSTVGIEPPLANINAGIEPLSAGSSGEASTNSAGSTSPDWMSSGDTTSSSTFGNNPPSASSGQSYPYLFHGQNPSLGELSRIGGNIPAQKGLQFYILYNNLWSQEYTSYWFGYTTNTLLYNDIPQYITIYEKYPDGQITRNDLGYINKGYFPGWFEADTKGVHELRVWGSQSGWSNTLTIYIQ
jgi:hypothetical protein